MWHVAGRVSRLSATYLAQTGGVPRNELIAMNSHSYHLDVALEGWAGERCCQSAVISVHRDACDGGGIIKHCPLIDASSRFLRSLFRIHVTDESAFQACYLHIMASVIISSKRFTSTPEKGYLLICIGWLTLSGRSRSCGSPKRSMRPLSFSQNRRATNHAMCLNFPAREISYNSDTLPRTRRLPDVYTGDSSIHRCTICLI